MKTIKYKIILVIGLLTFSFFSQFGQAYAAVCCPSPADPFNGCPLKVGAPPAELVFDRCFGASPIPGTPGYCSPTVPGNTVCNMVRDVNRVKTMITTGVIYRQDQAKRELEAFYRVIFQDAVNQNSIRTFNEAAKYQNAIVPEVTNYLNDRQCGSKYALYNLKSFFETQGIT